MDGLFRKLSAFYLSVFLVSGLALTFLIPPFQIPDENLHWISAVVRSEAPLDKERRVCSAALSLPDQFEVHRIKFRPDLKARDDIFSSLGTVYTCTADPVIYGNLLSYPAVPVLVPFFAVLPGELSGKQALLWFYLSRVLHGLLVFLALYRLRRAALLEGGAGTLFVFAFAVCPLFVQQCFAISSDVTTNALTITLLTALVFPSRLATLDWILLGGLGLSAGISKPTILPLAMAVLGVVFLWGREGLRKRVASLGGIILVGGIVMFARYRVTGTLSEIGSDPVRQAQFVMSHPLDALALLIRGVLEHLQFEHFYGRLGWLDTHLPTNARNLWVATLLAALTFDAVPFLAGLGSWAREGAAALKTAGSLLFVFLGSWISALGMAYALYLVFTVVGASKVAGLQGRYFFPHYLTMVGIIFWALRKNVEKPWTPDVLRPGLENAIVGITASASLFSLGRALFAVANRYW